MFVCVLCSEKINAYRHEKISDVGDFRRFFIHVLDDLLGVFTMQCIAEKPFPHRSHSARYCNFYLLWLNEWLTLILEVILNQI